jgi:hypothetical protein
VELLARLRAVAGRYARGLRAQGASPAHVRLRVTTLVRAAMDADRGYDPAALRVLTRQVVRWGLEAYHAR